MQSMSFSKTFKDKAENSKINKISSLKNIYMYTFSKHLGKTEFVKSDTYYLIFLNKGEIYINGKNNEKFHLSLDSNNENERSVILLKAGVEFQIINNKDNSEVVFLSLSSSNASMFLSLINDPIKLIYDKQEIISDYIIFLLNYFDKNFSNLDPYHLETFCIQFLYNIRKTILLEEEYKTSKIPREFEMIKNYIDSNFFEKLDLEKLAKVGNITVNQLSNNFSKYYKCAPIQHLNQTRLLRAKFLLETTDKKIHEIGEMVGIPNTNHFINLFKDKFAITPFKYQQTFRQNNK